jgi:hypothetical protein
MKAASSSETLVNIYQTTWCNITEDSHLHAHHHENIKSHQKVTQLRKQLFLYKMTRGISILFCMEVPAFNGLHERIPLMRSISIKSNIVGRQQCGCFFACCLSQHEKECEFQHMDVRTVIKFHALMGKKSHKCHILLKECLEPHTLSYENDGG